MPQSDTSGDVLAADVATSADRGAALQRDAAMRARWADANDTRAISAVPFSDRVPASSTIDLIEASARRRGAAPALSFILKGTADAPATTWSYLRFWDEITGLANGLHAAGHRPGEPVALLLPNLPETAAATFAAQAIGAAAPINPLLEPAIIGGILRESGATTLITLSPFMKTDVSQKAAAALAHAPEVKRVVEIDLAPYVPWPLRAVAKALRPRVARASDKTMRYRDVVAGATRGRFDFERRFTPETIGAYFHTGGTTGAPKLAMHHQRGMMMMGYNIQLVAMQEDDVVLSALPLFHIFSSYCMALSPFIAGAHVVLATPAGFRGDGVIQNFWKLIERWRATWLCGVPTAIAALDQVPVDADVSSLRFLVSGSAPLPTALFERFERNTGVRILEGYGLTEATCVTSCNPPDGDRKIGSVGLPAPYVDVRIAEFGENGGWSRDCETDEVGEICFAGDLVFAGYTEAAKTAECFFEGPDGRRWLKTGDLGRVDADGYIWITGRRKDLIIRGGHNIDPGMIEEALAAHPDVAFVGAIGQPDAYAGEKPCAYVELVQGGAVDAEALQAFAADRVAERPARPAHVEILDELPKTAVGKIYKPALRRRAISRVFDEALRAAGVDATIDVVEDRARGLVAQVRLADAADAEAAAEALAGFATPWERAPTSG